MTNSLWIVEVNFANGKGWQATTYAGLTRSEGRDLVRDWRANGETFVRLRKYRAV